MYSDKQTATIPLSGIPFNLGMRVVLPIFVALLVVNVVQSDEFDDGGNRILFSTVKSLQFSATQLATTRRGKRKPELKCTSGSASGFWWHPDWYPRVAKCVRYGSGDGGSNGAEWSCSAKLHKFLSLGETRVLCERYGEDARYILADSCRLEYELNFTKFTPKPVHYIYGSSLVTGLFLIYGLVRYRSMTTLNAKFSLRS